MRYVPQLSALQFTQYINTPSEANASCICHLTKLVCTLHLWRRPRYKAYAPTMEHASIFTEMLLSFLKKKKSESTEKFNTLLSNLEYTEN